MRLIALVLFVCISCTIKETKEEAKTSVSPLFIYPVVEGTDSVKNGSSYRAKVYLSSDSLYRVAAINKIANYLSIKYEDEVDGNTYTRASKFVEVHGDTGLVEFEIRIPDLKEDEIAEIYWLAQFDINYINNSDDIDTTFMNMKKLFVKGSEK